MDKDKLDMMKKLRDILGPRFIVVADLDFQGTQVLLAGATKEELPGMLHEVIRMFENGEACNAS